MPFADEAVRLSLACGPDATGRWRGHVTLSVPAAALWRLGLHPGQPASRIVGPSPPAWWHAEAERSWRRALTRPGW
ncbi:hypothetical protein [Dactylosporangium sp. CA-092794]|uniref:hypothetical protein n=1 Tax=Dactylosporangium sp. CA-092794 TaxID=3239929 RepID=UPI003D8BEF52